MAQLGQWDTSDLGLPISVKTMAAAARISGDIVQLLALDGLWTACARRNRSDETSELGPIVDGMDVTLSRLGEDAKTVLAMLDGVSETRVEAMLAALKSVNPDLAAKLRTRASRDGGLLAMVRKGLENAGPIFAEERSNLRGEFDRIRAGSKSGGDMGTLGQCGVGLIEMGLGLGMAGGLPLLVDGAERVVENCGG